MQLSLPGGVCYSFLACGLNGERIYKWASLASKIQRYFLISNVNCLFYLLSLEHAISPNHSYSHS